ncbi:MAG TPA: hypothetical protein VEO37_09000, partial [Thermoanaerobaculia bacterium]|nr:hypothetical protein [Thermoanaerobaculia bacterium]
EDRCAPPAARADHFALGSGEFHFLGVGRWALGAGYQAGAGAGRRSPKRIGIDSAAIVFAQRLAPSA